MAGRGAVDDLGGCTRCTRTARPTSGAIAHVAAMDDGRDWLAQLLTELE